MNNTCYNDSQRQETLKRRWQQEMIRRVPFEAFPGGGTFDDDLVSTVVPPVTVVLEGRSICQRVSLHNHASYQSLAAALRQMFVVDGGDHMSCSSENDTSSSTSLDLSNAVPGHLIAYEDMENDLLLVGDLNWKDFVRVAKRIRILPVKANSKKARGV
ncbi:hypothetical protein RHSIM_Rhsim01G0004500 [Rhododendron simsii]|uniref:Auxin-responsive protein n=1 Tax=Rhododendron simsii TaxID=118357 RepID=A0A834HJ98_RHOSS|nr:hypothetical protein RHSIM_Rhsim01G0004500 [Rhododendron simsii]